MILVVDEDGKASYECEICHKEFGDALPDIRDAKIAEHMNKEHRFEQALAE
jgi:hypothetical protein